MAAGKGARRATATGNFSSDYDEFIFANPKKKGDSSEYVSLDGSERREERQPFKSQSSGELRSFNVIETLDLKICNNENTGPYMETESNVDDEFDEEEGLD